ncbi:MAG: hypothetical protein HY820_19580 [Acidobacteria bacterium]|nr:hypothetical protein [Acidobacteriota bacterium]
MPPRRHPQFRSGCSTPDTAIAFPLNATAIPSGYLGYITLYRPGGSVPLASTLNAWQGQIVANAAIVPGLSSSGFGYVSAYLSDPTHLVLDINGYFAP